MTGAPQGLPAGYVCEKWSQLRHLILSLPEQNANYVALQHRNAEGKYTQVARCDLLPEFLHSWHVPEGQQPNDDDDDDDDDSSLEDGMSEQEEREGSIRSLFSERSATPPTPPMPRTWDELKAAALRYIVTHVNNNLEARSSVNGFRLRAYSSKGEAVLTSLIFEVRSASAPAMIPSPPSASPEETSLATRHNTQAPLLLPLELLNSRDPLAAYRALASYYAQFGQVLTNGLSNMMGISNDMLTGLYGQLKQSHKHRDDLVAAIVEMNMHREQRRDVSAANARDGDQRAALAEKALVQLTEAFKVIFTSQGMTPELAEVATIINAPPELMSALQNPAVRALMKKPKNLQGLALLLQQLALQQQQAEAAAAQGGGTSAQAPSAGSPGAQPGEAPAPNSGTGSNP